MVLVLCARVRRWATEQQRWRAKGSCRARATTSSLAQVALRQVRACRALRARLSWMRAGSAPRQCCGTTRTRRRPAVCARGATSAPRRSCRRAPVSPPASRALRHVRLSLPLPLPLPLPLLPQPIRNRRIVRIYCSTLVSTYLFYLASLSHLQFGIMLYKRSLEALLL